MEDAIYNIICLDVVLIAKNPVNPGVLISRGCSKENTLSKPQFRIAFENRMGLTIS